MRKKFKTNELVSSELKSHWKIAAIVLPFIGVLFSAIITSFSPFIITWFNKKLVIKDRDSIIYKLVFKKKDSIVYKINYINKPNDSVVLSPKQPPHLKAPDIKGKWQDDGHYGHTKETLGSKETWEIAQTGDHITISKKGGVGDGKFDHESKLFVVNRYHQKSDNCSLESYFDVEFQFLNDSTILLHMKLLKEKDYCPEYANTDVFYCLVKTGK